LNLLWNSIFFIDNYATAIILSNSHFNIVKSVFYYRNLGSDETNFLFSYIMLSLEFSSNAPASQVDEILKGVTSRKVIDTLKLIGSSSVNGVGLTRSYSEMMDRCGSSGLFSKRETLDLNTCVTNKASVGLVYCVMGQEAKNVLVGPSAVVTDLLRSVFGKQRFPVMIQKRLIQ
jgi:hypothetical protein